MHTASAPLTACGVASSEDGVIGTGANALPPVPVTCQAPLPVRMTRPPSVGKSHWMPSTVWLKGDAVIASSATGGLEESKSVKFSDCEVKNVSGWLRVLA